MTRRVQISHESIEASKAIQRILAAHAGYTGEIDGDWGPLSRAAMERFARAHGSQAMRQFLTAQHTAPQVTVGRQPGTQVATGEVETTDLAPQTRTVVADNVFRGRGVTPSS